MRPIVCRFVSTITSTGRGVAFFARVVHYLTEMEKIEAEQRLGASNIKVAVGIPTHNRASWLGQAIESVLSQSFGDFRLVVSDNASSDATEQVLESFADPRITYRSLGVNIGMINNFNRLIDSTESDLLLLLPDDDLLYPDYLASVVDVFSKYPNVGVVHTGFDLIDADGQLVECGLTRGPSDEPVAVESGAEYLARSMCQTWTICWSTAMFRRDAIAKVGGMRVNEEPYADAPLFMRIGVDWDFACIRRPLAACRLHAGSETAAVGTYTGSGYHLENLDRCLFDRRQVFLDEGRLPAKTTRRYRALAAHTLRRAEVRRLAIRAGAGASSKSTFAGLRRLVTSNPRTLAMPTMWKLVAAQLGGRRLLQLARRRRLTTSHSAAADAVKPNSTGRLKGIDP